MTRATIEKQLHVVNLKIAKTKKDHQWSVKSIISGFLIGIVFSFVAPFYGGKNSRKNLQEELNFDYIPTVIFCFILYHLFYAFVYFGLKTQARIKLNRLRSTKEKLEKRLQKIPK